MTTTLDTEQTALILSGNGYELTIDPCAYDRKRAVLSASDTVAAVTSNDESADAQHHLRKLAQMRIEVERCRKEIKEPVNRIGKMIDTAAKEFLADVVNEESRISQLISGHADRMLRLQQQKLREEQAAFDAARTAREAQDGTIASVIANKQALADRLAASEAVTETKVAQGVSFAWDFEVVDIEKLYQDRPDLIELTFRRAPILAMLREFDGGGLDATKIAASIGIRAFKKPVVSSR